MTPKSEARQNIDQKLNLRRCVRRSNSTSSSTNADVLIGKKDEELVA